MVYHTKETEEKEMQNKHIKNHKWKTLPTTDLPTIADVIKVNAGLVTSEALSTQIPIIHNLNWI